MSELKIQRWKPEAFLIGYEPHFNMLPTRNGDFVLHDVAQVEFDRLTAQVDELKCVINESLMPRLDAEFEDTDDGIIYMIREEITELLTRIGEDNA